VLNQDLTGFFVDAIFDGNFFEHSLTEAWDDGFRRFDFDHLVFNEFFECFGGHVAYQIAVQQHSLRVLYAIEKQRVYWVKRKTATEGDRNALLSNKNAPSRYNARPERNETRDSLRGTNFSGWRGAE
jgi:hypothetical protein